MDIDLWLLLTIQHEPLEVNCLRKFSSVYNLSFHFLNRASHRLILIIVHRTNFNEGQFTALLFSLIVLLIPCLRYSHQAQALEDQLLFSSKMFAVSYFELIFIRDVTFRSTYFCILITNFPNIICWTNYLPFKHCFSLFVKN